MKKKGFVHDNYLITNQCIPDIISNQNGMTVYTEIECDKDNLDWFKINYYEDFNCNQNSKIETVTFKNDECYHGDILNIVSCQGNERPLSSSSSSSSSSRSSSWYSS